MRYAELTEKIDRTLESVSRLQAMYLQRMQRDGSQQIHRDNLTRDIKARLVQFAKDCEVEIEYDCNDCEDTGESVIPAHQHGGEIVDEEIRPCHCQTKQQDHE